MLAGLGAQQDVAARVLSGEEAAAQEAHVRERPASGPATRSLHRVAAGQDVD